MDNTCFVIMPYNRKRDVDGKLIDFNLVYEKFIIEALRDCRNLKVVRCDDIAQAGWIHERMIEHILHARVAIVDTSTLNANVFYELGVRHALRKNVTVLIHREGTTFPFNIAGMSSLKYSLTPGRIEDAKETLRTWVVNSLDSGDVDSVVHLAAPQLRISHGPARIPRRIRQYATYEYRISGDERRRIVLITGDYSDIEVADVWVNSENTTMQMDRYFGQSTSAVIRYLGREVDAQGRVHDTIQEALTAQMNGRERTDPLEVMVTGPGGLRSNGVKWIFHVASVQGEPGEGFRPVAKVHRCVAQALHTADSERFADDPPRSILMPIFGTGPAGGDLGEHARYHLEQAIQYFMRKPNAAIQTVSFYAFNGVILETLQALAPQVGLVRGDGAE
jgi:O-acetyl-ADP-ribose deacetylase (regulator of RNase III)